MFATYLEGPNGVVSNPAEPVVPLVSADVGLADRVMRGIVFLGGSYADTPLVDNVVMQNKKYQKSLALKKRIWTGEDG